ncbi:MAG: molybdenum cofactor biosynthesis protein MoaE [Pseudomonadota bacterium]|nr:molybdenum cofactor biosynthesis protein MoaE [Pseudomonadota bacterium]
MFEVQVQTEDFCVQEVLDGLLRHAPGVGAVTHFIGIVREQDATGPILEMHLEHYPAMSRKALGQILDEAQERWPIRAAVVIHRVGSLKPGEQIVLVAVATDHRGDGFAACEYLMDQLKTRAPFWKKETTPGGARWVQARQSDERAAARWDS